MTAKGHLFCIIIQEKGLLQHLVALTRWDTQTHTIHKPWKLWWISCSYSYILGFVVVVAVGGQQPSSSSPISISLGFLLLRLAVLLRLHEAEAGAAWALKQELHGVYPPMFSDQGNYMTSVSSPSPPFKSLQKGVESIPFPVTTKKRRGCLWSNPRRAYGHDQKLFVSSRVGHGAFTKEKLYHYLRSSTKLRLLFK